MKAKTSASLDMKVFVAIVFAAMLSACSSSGNKPKPAELQALVPLVGAKQVWSNTLGAAAVQGSGITVAGNRVAVASGNGTLAVVDASTGADVWRASTGARLVTGAGFDGHMAAVVTDRNELLAAVSGQAVWRIRLPSAAYTAPLVAGQRVFVLSADRTVTAFDGNTGAKLWSQGRTGEPLVLRQPGVLLAVGDTLVAGLGGRLVGFNPSSGTIRWDVAVAIPRGSNDIERLVDLLGPAYRQAGQVCVRAYQAKIACVDAQRGTLSWSVNADGRAGLHGDDSYVFGVESGDKPTAWRRSNGEKAWTNDKLVHRELTPPLALGRSVAWGDMAGLVHLLSREDGTLMARLPTDGSAIVGAPALAGETLIALTRNGNLFAWRPQ
jgi:outer membrane assembly lipoprotein YfgL